MKKKSYEERLKREFVSTVDVGGNSSGVVLIVRQGFRGFNCELSCMLTTEQARKFASDIIANAGKVDADTASERQT